MDIELPFSLTGGFDLGICVKIVTGAPCELFSSERNILSKLLIVQVYVNEIKTTENIHINFFSMLLRWL